VRTRVTWCLLAAAIACGDDEGGGDASLDTSLRRPSLDAGARNSALDASGARSETDAMSLVACSSLDVCRDGKETGLFNVCFGSTASGGSSVAACLVDPNGTVYLATLAAGQQIVNVGWRQTGGTGVAALTTEDAQRCEEARAALTADAGVCSATP
jgi:hypothetical protein